jgi:hypothetical protein
MEPKALEFADSALGGLVPGFSGLEVDAVESREVLACATGRS